MGKQWETWVNLAIVGKHGRFQILEKLVYNGLSFLVLLYSGVNGLSIPTLTMRLKQMKTETTSPNCNQENLQTNTGKCASVGHGSLHPKITSLVSVATSNNNILFISIDISVQIQMIQI